MAQTQPRPDAASRQPPSPVGDGQAATTDSARAVQAQAAAAIGVPERPALAPGVKPAGQMQESAFVDPPWLLEREGAGYIQVTQLLYRVAEQCNGERTLEEIAREVSDATNRAVSADNVRTLVEKQLIPKGLVATADGKVTGDLGGGSRSPLAINMKMAMIPPRLVDGITGALRVLFWPPVLIGALIAAALGQAWMYFVHGVGGSVHDALYAPGLMLLVLGVIVVSAAFHELGHAAALGYAGGKVRGMGAGIYLVYPAFYTDVSDNYKLRRWARVRTDLGGFYFNLLFALAIMALYVVTGQEFLLLIVVLINLEIIHQLLPFGRLDGYWTLADITGVPDFFSQMGAFVRGVLPIKGWEGRKLPELKSWAKAIFGLYVLITVPLLLFLLFVTLKSAPQILATAWDSFGQQAGAFSAARGAGDFLGMAGAVVQVLALGLPTLGLLFTFYTLGRRLIAAVWNWSKPTPTRRVVGGLGSLGAVGLLAYLWAPQLPFGGGQPGPLYRYSQENFAPIPRDARGTILDAVGAPPLTIRTPLEERFDENRPMPAPTTGPTTEPAAGPTVAPTAEPTAAPTAGPTAGPTTTPAAVPTTAPTAAPALAPAAAPTAVPKVVPTAAPAGPTATAPAGVPKPKPSPVP